MKLLTRSVTRESQLEIGAWYLIKGSTSSGFPLPPQVFHLEQKHIPITAVADRWVQGWMLWGCAGQIFESPNHRLQLHQVNVPEHGEHDIHLERVDDQQAAEISRNVTRYREIEQDKWK